MAPDIENIFSAFEEYLNKEQEVRDEIRNIVKGIQQAGNKIVITLQIIHEGKTPVEIKSSCKKSREIIEEVVKPGYKKLNALIKPQITNEYYRYHDQWRFVTQRMAFLAALIVYLESGKLVEWDEAAEILGITSQREIGFHLDLEDFLIGLLYLGPELSRFAKTSVTHKDYNRPFEIHKFIKDLFNGFLNLNLKNDALRKKFDSLKYEVNRVEDVVYDLTKPEKAEKAQEERSSKSKDPPKPDERASKGKDPISPLAANWKDPPTDN